MIFHGKVLVYQTASKNCIPVMKLLAQWATKAPVMLKLHRCFHTVGIVSGAVHHHNAVLVQVDATPIDLSPSCRGNHHFPSATILITGMKETCKAPINKKYIYICIFTIFISYVFWISLYIYGPAMSRVSCLWLIWYSRAHLSQTRSKSWAINGHNHLAALILHVSVLTSSHVWTSMCSGNSW